ncbi:hypothetical protein GOODEAATRI_011104 [Goodea atripinnis]|uniref:F5/8 type C domain-containing protein n=1 Tax=Goodea atripinnis TaxID=208336 RepID=A0ABV0MR74_9TELE
MFRGNLDSSKVKDNSFSPPFVARYVRIHPHSYQQKPALRLELLGCDLNRIITQGARSMLTKMMVTEFSVTFSQDGHSWSSVLEESSQREKIFTGNNDPDEEAFTVFEPPLFAHYLRIHPRGWVNDIALRLEVVGCDTQRGVGYRRTKTQAPAAALQ